jgi:hypothetical protein
MFIPYNVRRQSSSCYTVVYGYYSGRFYNPHFGFGPTLFTMKALVVISIRKLYRAELVYLSF